MLYTGVSSAKTKVEFFLGGPDSRHSCDLIGVATVDVLSVLAGFDVDHFERIPDRGGALLVLYHGALPLDFYYLWAKVQLGKRRAMYMVADRFLWKIPGENHNSYPTFPSSSSGNSMLESWHCSNALFLVTPNDTYCSCKTVTCTGHYLSACIDLPISHVLDCLL